jgi:hypothetical protein
MRKLKFVLRCRWYQLLGRDPCDECSAVGLLIKKNLILETEKKDIIDYWTPERATGALAFYLVMTYGYDDAVKLTST